MCKQLNEIQFIHRLDLAGLTKTILNIADQNNIEESDICTLAGILYYFNGKSESDITKLLTDTLLFNRVEIRKMKSEGASYDVERIKYIAKNFFTNFSPARISQAFSIPLSHLEINGTVKYNDFILTFLKGNYSSDDDDTFIEAFIDLGEKGDYTNCVRLYLLSLVLGKFKLVEKLSLIQNRKFHSTFIYSLNQELIFLINLLVRYGKGNKIDILSEETVEMCNSAIEELTHKISEQQYEHVMEKLELTNKIKEQNMIIKGLEETINELKIAVQQYQDIKALNGKKVLVIADETRKEGYKNIVEKYGAEFDFASGMDTNIPYIIGRANSADEVFFCTAYAKHKLYHAGIKDLDNVHYFHNVGCGSLEQAITDIK